MHSRQRMQLRLTPIISAGSSKDNVSYHSWVVGQFDPFACERGGRESFSVGEHSDSR